MTITPTMQLINKRNRIAYKGSEVEALSPKWMAEPDIIFEIIHIQHQSPHPILAEKSNKILKYQKDKNEQNVKTIMFDHYRFLEETKKPLNFNILNILLPSTNSPSMALVSGAGKKKCERKDNRKKAAEV